MGFSDIITLMLFLENHNLICSLAITENITVALRLALWFFLEHHDSAYETAAETPLQNKANLSESSIQLSYQGQGRDYEVSHLKPVVILFIYTFYTKFILCPVSSGQFGYI